jgi:threonine aldolase
MQFFSDNTAPAAPLFLRAIESCNQGMARAYGDDDGSRRLEEAFSSYFGCKVRVFALSTGTAANALSLATLVPPYGAVLTTEHSHTLHDECGACELQSGGARLVGLASEHGRLDADVLDAWLADHTPSVHSVQPAAVSITQATECGTLYTPAQVAAIAAVARRRALPLHMDGARFANALAALDCSPAAMTWQCGVDVLSFGATKNGALTAEAVVFFDPALARDFELRRKRAGHLLSKMRFVSAQLLAAIEDPEFMAMAKHANRLARRIAQACPQRLIHPSEANAVFLSLEPAIKQQLREQGFGFYDWGPARQHGSRFVVSWNQDEADVERLCEALRAWN